MNITQPTDGVGVQAQAACLRGLCSWPPATPRAYTEQRPEPPFQPSSPPPAGPRSPSSPTAEEKAHGFGAPSVCFYNVRVQGYKPETVAGTLNSDPSAGLVEGDGRSTATTNTMEKSDLQG